MLGTDGARFQRAGGCQPGLCRGSTPGQGSREQSVLGEDWGLQGIA